MDERVRRVGTGRQHCLRHPRRREVAGSSSRSTVVRRPDRSDRSSSSRSRSACRSSHVRSGMRPHASSDGVPEPAGPRSDRANRHRCVHRRRRPRPEGGLAHEHRPRSAPSSTCDRSTRSSTSRRPTASSTWSRLSSISDVASTNGPCQARHPAPDGRGVRATSADSIGDVRVVLSGLVERTRDDGGDLGTSDESPRALCRPTSGGQFQPPNRLTQPWQAHPAVEAACQSTIARSPYAVDHADGVVDGSSRS